MTDTFKKCAGWQLLVIAGESPNVFRISFPLTQFIACVLWKLNGHRSQSRHGENAEISAGQV